MTQRQAVNVPLMKETVKTLLSGVDDPPSVEWKELSGDQMKEIIYQQMWDDNYEDEGLELKDVQDKKNVFMYGISTKMLNLKENGVSIKILDVFDVLYDPLTNPLDIETARFIVRQNIFRPLRDILVDKRYTQKGKDKLKHWLATDKGIVQSGKNKEAWEKSMERLRSMGVQNEKFPVFAGGDVIVNLTEQYTELWETTEKKFVRHVITYADETVELLDQTLMEAIGIEEWPMDFWGEDPETNDVYQDSVCDTIRTPNKILNIWFSQLVENRTLQNFQMHWFDATVQGYSPQTYEPGPGRMLPAPGDPNKTILPVQINGLDETFQAMDYIIGMSERATGATALEKGTPEEGQQTLGEVRVLVGKATERAKTVSKFYRNAWKRTARKWDMIMQANEFPEMTLYKTGNDGKKYSKTVTNKDWKSIAGYCPEVSSSSEQEADDIKTIQKFGVVLAQYPNNTALKQIALSRELKVLDLTPGELQEVLDGQVQADKMDQAMAMQSVNGEAAAGSVTPGPQAPATAAQPDVSNEIEQLGQLLAH
jgi:hypothetical protein